MIRMRYYFVAYSQLDCVYCSCSQGCLWYVWDTILWPIHNIARSWRSASPVVYDTYEILFCGLFTTISEDIFAQDELFMIRMRYYFVAYSQHWCSGLCCVAVVYDTYEILFCGLFTTELLKSGKYRALFMIRMRYYFVAYSQHAPGQRVLWWCCLWYVWDTILWPIHNTMTGKHGLMLVVYDTYEILFCGLFTTEYRYFNVGAPLFMIRMRYYFVAYSQL